MPNRCDQDFVYRTVTVYGSAFQQDSTIDHTTVETSPVFRALLDDLNSPAAIAELHQLAKALNKSSGDARVAAKSALLAGGAALGILSNDPVAWFELRGTEALSADIIETLLAERTSAKAAKDFARADAIRDELNNSGVVIEDSASGSTWRRA